MNRLFITRHSSGAANIPDRLAIAATMREDVPCAAYVLPEGYEVRGEGVRHVVDLHGIACLPVLVHGVPHLVSIRGEAPAARLESVNQGAEV